MLQLITRVTTTAAALLVLSTVALAQGPGRRAFGAPGAGLGRFGFGLGAGPVVTGQPYSGTGVSTSTRALANGNVITQNTCTKIYRDSAGRTRQEETLNSSTCGTTPSTIVIRDPVAGVEYRINAANNTYQQFMFKAPAASSSQTAPRGPGRFNSTEVQSTDLGSQPIAGTGLNAQGTQTIRTIPAGQIGNAQPIETVHEMWMSDELKVPVMVKTTDPRSGASTTQLTNINRAEPDAALFQVPSDYTVKTGSGGPTGPGRRGPRQ